MGGVFRFLLVSCFFVGTLTAPAQDEVTHLPGMKNLPPFKQYSGYLDASGTKHLHYWFVESQREPGNDPVVLWLNGGPGCSSLDGYLSENGPLHVRDDGATLYANPYSWNKLANVIYLESPAGVGYSYDDNGDVKTDDDQVASHNYAALQHFFRKFPEYQKNPFFITGESYGGIYVPTLSLKVRQDEKFNFKGFAVGNGLSSYKLNENSLVFFAYYHGLIGESLWSDLLQACCKGGFTKDNCSFQMPGNAACDDYAKTVYDIIYQSGLNEYSLYLDCAESNLRQKSYRFAMNNLFLNLDPTFRKKVLSKKIQAHPVGNGFGQTPPCINSTAQKTWLNRQDVRDALHIPSGVQKWDICSDEVGNQYERIYKNMSKVYENLLKYPEMRMLVYNGDTDMACNFLGDQWFVASLNLPEVRPHAPWYVNEQVAGFAREFKQLTFTTIRGSGHMVPQWAPSYAYVMFEKFLNNKPFHNTRSYA